MIKGFAHIALYTTKFKETINFYKEIFDAKEMGYFKTKTDACWLSVGDDILEIFNGQISLAGILNQDMPLINALKDEKILKLQEKQKGK